MLGIVDPHSGKMHYVSLDQLVNPTQITGGDIELIESPQIHQMKLNIKDFKGDDYNTSLLAVVEQCIQKQKEA
jgi:hypothetical protein